jgi:hypothetical protein
MRLTAGGSPAAVKRKSVNRSAKVRTSLYIAPTPDLGPTQRTVEWVTGRLSLSIKRPGQVVDDLPSSRAEVKNSESVLPLLHTSSLRDV